MLQSAYLLAKIGADTAENERNFAENLQKIGNYPYAEEPEERLLRGAAAAVPGRGEGRRRAVRLRLRGQRGSGERRNGRPRRG